MRAVSRAATTVLTVVALACTAAVASAAAPAPLSPGTRYLALGDSVTFGFQESQVVPAPNYHHAGSFLGYPEFVGKALHVKVVNASCPGETTASLIDAAAPSNHCENGPNTGSPLYRVRFPLHVHYTGSQLGFAVRYLRSHKDVRLVSLMIGANDAFLCQETTADKCSSAAELTAMLARISKNVKTILSSIRSRAHYTGQLSILNYYSLDYSSALANAQSLVLNKTVDTAAKPFHVIIADGFGELKAAATHFGGKTCAAGLLNVVGPFKCGVHPSYAGQTLLAQAIEKVIRN